MTELELLKQNAAAFVYIRDWMSATPGMDWYNSVPHSIIEMLTELKERRLADGWVIEDGCFINPNDWKPKAEPLDPIPFEDFAVM